MSKICPLDNMVIIFCLIENIHNFLHKSQNIACRLAVLTSSLIAVRFSKAFTALRWTLWRRGIKQKNSLAIKNLSKRKWILHIQKLSKLQVQIAFEWRICKGGHKEKMRKKMLSSISHLYKTTCLIFVYLIS